MTKIMFVCHGNICRSPMAQFVMQDMVDKAGLHDEFYISSAATSTEEIGNPVHPGTRRKLNENGISCEGKRAVQIKSADYERYDYIIVMDSLNMRNLRRIIKNDDKHKIHKLLDFTPGGGDIADPWYTGNFDVTYSDIVRGCQGLLERVRRV
ncbi:MAG: low molecular weight protein-tyrosine-phosphatase [Acutalibacteraceae bacterium]